MDGRKGPNPRPPRRRAQGAVRVSWALAPGGPELTADLQALGLQVVTGTAGQAARAAELVHLSKLEKDKQAGQTLARGDGQALALAEHLNLPAITGDTLWTELRHLVRVPVELFR
jgi:hypothetical protein